MECGWVYNNGHLSDAPSVCVCVYHFTCSNNVVHNPPTTIGWSPSTRNFKLIKLQNINDNNCAWRLVADDLLFEKEAKVSSPYDEMKRHSNSL